MRRKKYTPRAVSSQAIKSGNEVKKAFLDKKAKVVATTPEPEGVAFSLDPYVSEYAANADAKLLSTLYGIYGVQPSVVSAQEVAYHKDYLTRAMDSASAIGSRLVIINKSLMGSGKTTLSMDALRNVRTLYITPRKALAHDVEANLASVNINTNPALTTKHVHTTGYLTNPGLAKLRKWCDAGEFVVVFEEISHQLAAMRTAYATLGLELRLASVSWDSKTEFDVKSLQKTSAFDVNTLAYTTTLQTVLVHSNIKHIIINDADFSEQSCTMLRGSTLATMPLVVTGGGCALGAEHQDKRLRRVGDDSYAYVNKTSNIHYVEGRFSHQLRREITSGSSKIGGKPIMHALSAMVSTLNQGKRVLVFVPSKSVAKTIMQYAGMTYVHGGRRTVRAVMLDKNNIEQMSGDSSINTEVSNADIVFHTTSVTAGTSFTPLSGQMGDISFGLHLFIVDYFCGPRPKYATARDYLTGGDFKQMLGRDRTSHRVDIIVCVGKDSAVQARGHKADRVRLADMHEAMMYAWAVMLGVKGTVWEGDLDLVLSEIELDIDIMTQYEWLYHIRHMLQPAIKQFAEDIHLYEDGGVTKLDPLCDFIAMAALYRNYSKSVAMTGVHKPIWDALTTSANMLRDALKSAEPGSYAEHIRREAEYSMTLWGSDTPMKLAYDSPEEYIGVLTEALGACGYIVNEPDHEDHEIVMEKFHIQRIWHLLPPEKDVHIWSVTENAGLSHKPVPVSPNSDYRDMTTYSVSFSLADMYAKKKKNGAKKLDEAPKTAADSSLHYVSEVHNKRSITMPQLHDQVSEAESRTWCFRKINHEVTFEHLDIVRAVAFPKFDRYTVSAIDICGGMSTTKRLSDSLNEFKTSSDFGTKETEAELAPMLPDHVKQRHSTCRVQYAVIDGIMRDAGVVGRVTSSTRAGFMATMMALSWLDPTWGDRHEVTLARLGNTYVNGVDGYDTTSEARTLGMVKNALSNFEWQRSIFIPSMKTSGVDHAPDRTMKAFMAAQTSRHMASLELGFCKAITSLCPDENITIAEVVDKIIFSLFGGYKSNTTTILRLYKVMEGVVVDMDGWHDEDTGRHARNKDQINLHQLSVILLWRGIVTEVLGRYTRVLRDNGKLLLIVDTLGDIT